MNENKNIKLCVAAGRNAERDIYSTLEERKGLKINHQSSYLRKLGERTKSTILSNKKGEIEPRAEINETENRKTVEEINETNK